MAAELDFHAVFESSPNPYMLVDPELRYVAANRASRASSTRRETSSVSRMLAATRRS
jgi:hypothetical protein